MLQRHRSRLSAAGLFHPKDGSGPGCCSWSWKTTRRKPYFQVELENLPNVDGKGSSSQRLGYRGGSGYGGMFRSRGSRVLWMEEVAWVNGRFEVVASPRRRPVLPRDTEVGRPGGKKGDSATSPDLLDTKK